MPSTIHKLYGGKVKLSYLEQAGRHRYLIDGKEKVGVTTIIKEALNSGPPMTWPMYEAISHLKLNDGDYEGASKAYLSKSDRGKDDGTIIHGLIENYINTGNIELDALLGENVGVARAINGFSEWFETFRPMVINTEQVVYSRDGDYAGKYDALFTKDDKVILVDFKTTNKSKDAPAGIYWHNFIQLGGYGYAWSEMNNDLIDDYGVINVGKDGKTKMILASEINLSVEQCNQAFIGALNVYQFKKLAVKGLK